MCGSRRADASGSTNVPREVLPTNVKPVHYDLTLEPNFESFKYDGTVVIEYVSPCAALFGTNSLANSLSQPTGYRGHHLNLPQLHRNRHPHSYCFCSGLSSQLLARNFPQ
jgi:hypothetical protein